MLKQVTKDADIVPISNQLVSEVCLLRYLRNMKRVSIDDVNKKAFELKKEAYKHRKVYRNFVKQYEDAWNIEYNDFNLLQKEEVRMEFKKVYLKLKKNGGV